MVRCDPICFIAACAYHQRRLAHDAYRSELRDALLVYGCSFLDLYQNFDASRVRWPWTYIGNVARFDSSEQDGSAGFKSTRITQVCAIRQLATAELCVCQIDDRQCQYQKRRQHKSSNFCLRCHRFISWARTYFSNEAANAGASAILSGTRSRNCRMRGC